MLDELLDAARGARAQLLALQPVMAAAAGEIRTVATTLQLRGVPISPALSRCDPNDLVSFIAAVDALSEIFERQSRGAT